MPSIFYSLFCIVILLSLLSPSVSIAAVYQWKDKNGKIHFSDTPPVDIKANKKEIKTGKIGSVSSGYYTKAVQPLTAIDMDKTNTKLLKLDSVIVDLDIEDESNKKIGAEYYGPACSRRHSTLDLKAVSYKFDVRRYRRKFSQIMQANGYRAEETDIPVFLINKINRTGLVFTAEIRNLQVNSCTQNRQQARDKQALTATYMSVYWSVYDSHTGKIIFQVTTEGSDNGLYYRSNNLGKQTSQLQAFRMAAGNLLANKKLIELFKKGAPTKAIDTDNSELERFAGLPLSVKMRSGGENNKFTRVVWELKRGSVTIRSSNGHGSGFIFSEKGYVVTNAHVVRGEKKVIVVFDNMELEAKILRVDRKRDVALLKINNFKGRGLRISGYNVSEGEKIYIIGTPLHEKLSHTVTSGIISAKRRLDDGNNYYQTDAAINAGNSGGPVFNENGNVIGIAVSGLLNQSGGSLNINFIIPINDAFRAVNVIRR